MRFSPRTPWVLLLPLFVPPADALAQSSPTPVVVAPVIQRDVTTSRSFVGTVQPTRRSVTGAAVAGRVSELLVQAGDRVRRGQPLVRLATESIMLELEAEQAELEFRTQQLAEMEAGTRPGEIARAKAQMEGAEARMEFLQSQRRRTVGLFDKGVTTQDEREEGVSLAVAAEQSFQQAKAAYELAVAGPRKEAVAQTRAQGRKQRAVVGRIQERIRNHTIAAPFDGYVTATHTEVGQWLAEGASVVEVVALDSVDVVVHIPEAHVGDIAVGAESRIDLQSKPGLEFDARVVSVTPQADVPARTFPVKLRVKNQIGRNGPTLKPGMLTRAQLTLGRTAKALLVPKDALVINGAKTTVFVVDASNGTVRSVPVERGIRTGPWIQVAGDLKPGEKVIVRGNERLKDGQRVAVSEESAPAMDDLTASAGSRFKTVRKQPHETGQPHAAH